MAQGGKRAGGGVTLQQLRAFVLTARHGKLASVARAMGVTQPTVTFHLSKLEERLGLPLFASSERSVWRLTEFGQSFYDHATRMIALEDEIAKLARDAAALGRGRIRVGSTHTPATYLFPGVIAEFRSRYGGIEISLDVAPAHLLLPKVFNYALDFCCINHFPSAAPGMAARPLMEDRLVLIAHPESPAARAPHLRPSDFETLPVVMHEIGSMTRNVLDAWCHEHRIQPNVLMDVSGTETMKQMVLQNLGVAMVSALSCRAEVAAGALVARPLPAFTTRRTIYLVQRRDVRLAPAAQAFVRALDLGAAALATGVPSAGTDGA